MNNSKFIEQFKNKQKMLYKSVNVNSRIWNQKINDNLNSIDVKENQMMNKFDETKVKAGQNLLTYLKDMSLNKRKSVQ